MNNGVGRAFDNIASHQEVADGKYTKVVYFDISDTDTYDQAKWDEFYNEANMTNISHEFNQKAIDLMSDKEKANLGQLQNQAQDDTQNQTQDDTQDDNQPIIKDNAVNAKLTIEAIIEMIGKNKIYADTMKIIQTRPNAIDDILRSYYSHNDNIDREKDRGKKNAMLDICVSVTELELHIGLPDVASKWDDVSHYFKTMNDVVQMSNNTSVLINKVREKQRDYVMVESRILREAAEFTFNDFLKDLGVTPQEIKQQIQANAQSQKLANEEKEIKSSFDNMWNRIIEANKMNHGVIW